MVEHDSTSKCIGLLYSIMASISFTLFNTFFKMIKKLSIPEIFLVRSVVQIVLVLPFLLTLWPDVRGIEGSRLLLWFGSLISFATTYFEFASVSILPFGDALTILDSSPVIVMIFSHCIFKEHCGIYKTLVVALLLIGISFITKPTIFIQILNYLNIPAHNESLDATNQTDLTTYGYIAAICGTTCLSFSTIVRKKLSATTHFSVIIFSCSIANILGSAIAIPLLPPSIVPDNWADLIYALLVGVFNMSMTMFIILSLRRLSASLVSVVRCLEIVMAYIVQITWFKESPDVLCLVGATIVILSVVFMTQEENMSQLMFKCSLESKESEILPLVKNNDEE